MTLLHDWGAPKPWDTHTHDDFANAYTTCLLRLLDARDVAIRIDRDEIPRWLRRGITGVAARRRATSRRAG